MPAPVVPPTPGSPRVGWADSAGTVPVVHAPAEDGPRARTVMAHAVAQGLAIAYLTVVGALLFWSVIPAALGWRSSVIVSGSMEPKIHVGDVVATSPAAADDVKIGQVALVRDPASPDHFLTHRVVARDGQGRLVTKGDANRNRDSTPVPKANVIGLARLDVPYIARPLMWWQTGRRAATAGLLLLTVLALGLAGSQRYADPGADRAAASDDPDR